MAAGEARYGLSDDVGDDVTAQQDERLEETEDQPEVWEGEPLQLNRDGIGDNFWLGLVSNITLPGKHVHPAIRGSAEQVLGAQAELDQLRRKLAARPGEREELMRASRQLSDRAIRLREFDSETEYLKSFDVPEAESGLFAAWESFAASLQLYGAKWDEYLYSTGLRVVEEGVALLEAGIAKLAEAQLIDQLIGRVGIYHIDRNSPAAAAATQERYYRDASLGTITGGQDLGAEGPRFGLIPLLLEYRGAFTRRG
jgi:hypothetical protein